MLAPECALTEDRGLSMTIEEEIAAFRNCDTALLHDLLAACQRVVRQHFEFGVDDLEDIAIGAVERATLNLEKFRRKCSLKTWIVAIATNIARERIRRQPTVSLDDPTALLEATVNKSEVDALLDRLVVDEIAGNASDEERRLLQLTMEGYDAAEIGKELNRTANAVRLMRSRLFAGLRDLYREMEE